MSGSAYGGVDRHQDLAGLTNDDHTQYNTYLSGTYANRPAPSRAGRIYYATDIGMEFIDSGTSWLNANFAPVTAYVATSETTASTTYVDLATVHSASVVVGSLGRVLVQLSSWIHSDTAGATTLMTAAVSGATTVAASDTTALKNYAFSAGSDYSVSIAFELTGLNPGTNVVTAKHKVLSGTGTYANRRMTVTPI